VAFRERSAMGIGRALRMHYVVAQAAVTVSHCHTVMANTVRLGSSV